MCIKRLLLGVGLCFTIIHSSFVESKNKEEHVMLLAIVAAHTDDAEFNAGGTAVNFVKAGGKVVIINLTSPSPETISCGRKGAGIIGADVEFVKFPQGGITDNPESSKRLEDVLDKYKPDIILSHWPVDEHSDHRAAATMTIKYVSGKQQKFTAKDAGPDEYCPQLMFFEALVGKQSKCFKPEVYVELSAEVFEKKKELMRIYTGELMDGYMKSSYNHHLMMMEFRARESGACRQTEIDKGIWAEAFITFPVPRGKSRLHLPSER